MGETYIGCSPHSLAEFGNLISPVVLTGDCHTPGNATGATTHGVLFLALGLPGETGELEHSLSRKLKRVKA